MLKLFLVGHAQRVLPIRDSGTFAQIHAETMRFGCSCGRFLQAHPQPLFQKPGKRQPFSGSLGLGIPIQTVINPQCCLHG